MVGEIKDTAANGLTIMGTGSIVLGWEPALTIVLLVTGIIFNIVRIVEIRKRKK